MLNEQVPLMLLTKLCTLFNNIQLFYISSLNSNNLIRFFIEYACERLRFYFYSEFMAKLMGYGYE